MARDQLSVKQYLIVFGVLCAPLLVWTLYVMIFTESISAVPAKVGQPIVVRGRYPGWHGANYVIFVEKEPFPVGGTDEVEEADSAGAGVATRGWLGNYRFEIAIEPVNEPGDYNVFFNAMEHEGVSTATTTVTVSP